MFKYTTAIKKIRALKKFIKGIQGGTSAGKTFGIIPIEIDYCAKNPLTETSIVAESVPHLKRGAMKDFKKIMKETNRWVDSRWNATDFKYTFANGSYIEFFSADNDSKLRGARRDRLYMNEANNMTFHAYTELASRTKISVTLDWNPTSNFWFHEELLNDSDVDFLIINYEDNEACPESALNFILKAKEKSLTSDFWRNWYNVYGLGLIGNLQGVVFDNWKQVDRIPEYAKLKGYGMDFGFTNDPTTLIAIYEFEGIDYWDEIIYQTQLTNSELSKLMKSKSVSQLVNIVSDSAEPKSIKDLKNMGWSKLLGAEKGKDSINNGINYIQEKEIRVTSHSLNLIKELRSYVWQKDSSGKATNKPIDAFNHCIDAIRYYYTIEKKPKPKAPRATYV
jgi:phage terminase large subunit